MRDFAGAHPGCRLLLALDQFEDLIFECKDEARADPVPYSAGRGAGGAA